MAKCKFVDPAGLRRSLMAKLGIQIVLGLWYIPMSLAQDSIGDALRELETLSQAEAARAQACIDGAPCTCTRRTLKKIQHQLSSAVRLFQRAASSIERERASLAIRLAAAGVGAILRAPDLGSGDTFLELIENLKRAVETELHKTRARIDLINNWLCPDDVRSITKRMERCGRCREVLVGDSRGDLRQLGTALKCYASVLKRQLRLANRECSRLNACSVIVYGCMEQRVEGCLILRTEDGNSFKIVDERNALPSSWCGTLLAELVDAASVCMDAIHIRVCEAIQDSG